uniref:Transmembrane protein 182 n=1 Tax=Oncorhynchus tshawytscha TaxID=74940 RepID=A0AAZ3RMQ5_ONCTS
PSPAHTMKLSVALFFAGMFGALAAMFVLLSFETDYWFLASETCNKETNGTMGPWASAIERRPDTTFYHEGFFWRSYYEILRLSTCVCVGIFKFMSAYHSVTHVYRGFWSIFMLIGVTAVVMGGFFIICAAPFASHRLYKAGGGLFLMSALFLLGVVWMSVLWVELMDVVQFSVDHQRSSLCPTFNLTIHYGLSSFFAPVGISFCLLAGLLFLLIGRSVQMQYH